nr:uncharacterized protein LOC118973277 [Manis javanica]
MGPGAHVHQWCQRGQGAACVSPPRWRPNSVGVDCVCQQQWCQRSPGEVHTGEARGHLQWCQREQLHSQQPARIPARHTTTWQDPNSVASAVVRNCSLNCVRAAVRRPRPGASGPSFRPRNAPGGAQMVDPRCARLRLPPGSQAPAAPTSPPGLGSPPRAGWAPGATLAASRLSRGGRRAAIGPDLEPPPWPDLRSSSCASFSLAPSDLRRSVQSGPRFRGEGDSDGSAGRKATLWIHSHFQVAHRLCPPPQFSDFSIRNKLSAG